MARVAKRFVPFSRGGGGDDDDDLSEAMVRRFERLADGADSFFNLVERGGSRRRPKITTVFLPAAAAAALAPSSLAAGKATELSLRMSGGTAVMLLQPWWLGGFVDGKAACLWMSYEHDTEWEKNLKLVVAFRVSESSSSSPDMMRIAMDCVELLPPSIQLFSAARAVMKELVAEMSFHGRSSPAPSAVYVSFVRAIRNSHRYGFDQSRGGGGAFTCGGSPLPDPVLMICTHCYVSPPVRRSGLPLELVWHRSPHYLPKKLSEQHEPLVELLPGVADGFYQQEEEEAEAGRQWWCPRSSTCLSMVPIASPPKECSAVVEGQAHGNWRLKGDFHRIASGRDRKKNIFSW